jgi:hypothetical protein
MGWRPVFYNWDKHGTRTSTTTLAFYKLLKQSTKAIERAEKLLNKINFSQTLAINRSKLIPRNATLGCEYIKCGKDVCNHETHGPYYYAYWKDSKTKKLKKNISVTVCQTINKKSDHHCNNNDNQKSKIS